MIHDPGGLGFRIESLWAYLAIHDDGDEAVIGVGTTPLIGADKDRIESYRPWAEEMAGITPKPIILVQFTHRIDLETLGGK